MDKTPVPYNNAALAATTNNWHNSPGGIQAQIIENLNLNFPGNTAPEALQALLTSMYGSGFPALPVSHAMEWFGLDREHYCLFVLENECYNNGVFSIAKSRALEKYTHPDIQNKYKSLPVDAIEHLKHMPCIFARRNMSFGHTDATHPVVVGRLTDIIVQHETVKFCFTAFLPPFPQQILNAHTKELHMATCTLRNELDEEHWAIKDADLIQALSDFGVHIN